MAIEELTKPSHTDSKKSKLLQVALLLTLFGGILFKSGEELGLFNVSVEGNLAVNSQTAKLANDICQRSAAKQDLEVREVWTRPGLREFQGFSSDTVVCIFSGNQSIPFMLIYDDKGTFVDFQ